MDETLLSPAPPTRINHLKQFYLDFVLVLTEPREFFARRFSQTSLTYALTYGVIISWITAFLSWLVRLARHETLFDGWAQMRQRLHDLPIGKSLPESFWAQSSEKVSSFPSWMADLLGIALAPFQSLLSLCFSGVILYIGAYLLIPKRKMVYAESTAIDLGNSYQGEVPLSASASASGPASAPVIALPVDAIELSNFIRIVCFTSTPQIFSALLGFLPMAFASFITAIYALVLLVIALTSRYKISGLRAVGVWAMPWFVAFFLVSCLIGAGIALFWGVISAMFGAH